jgi:hypothetical protein
MAKLRVLVIDRAFSRKGHISYAVMLMPRDRKTHCGRCMRGIVIMWHMGSEPIISNCRICGAITEVDIRGRLNAK